MRIPTNLPQKKPKYSNPNLSPYQGHFNLVADNESVDPLHFGSSLIEQIKNEKQEIGSHTFSHYYCLEKGQTKEDFREDLLSGKKYCF